MIQENRHIDSRPFDLLELVLRNGTLRKCRLLIGECCRRVGQEHIGNLCEGVAEGKTDAEQLYLERHRPWLARIFTLNRRFNPTRVPPTDQLREFVWHALNYDSRAAVSEMIDIAPPELRGQWRDLIHDIFGNQQASFDPRWLTSSVLELAETIYESGQFDRMPILGDALMDAGCDNAEIIQHCQDGPHFKGCWVIDLILGKE